MKLKMLLIGCMSLVTLSAQGAVTPAAQIAKARALIGSIKNNSHHKGRLDKITNNRFDGRPGVIDTYLTKQHALYSEKMNIATQEAENVLNDAKKGATAAQLKTIELLTNQLYVY